MLANGSEFLKIFLKPPYVDILTRFSAFRLSFSAGLLDQSFVRLVSLGSCVHH